MVNADMFKGAFVLPKKIVPAQPVVYPKSPVQLPNEDPRIDKLRFLVLKWLTIAVGGGAVLLVVWRILLKFL